MGLKCVFGHITLTLSMFEDWMSYYNGRGSHYNRQLISSTVFIHRCEYRTYRGKQTTANQGCSQGCARCIVIIYGVKQ